MSMWIDLLRTLDPAEALMRRERKMTDIEILAALSRLKVQTGSLACLGCGYEHNCGVHGCAIRRETACLIERRAEELAKLRSTREWIPVKERLPENERPVLAFVGYADTMTGFMTVSTYFAFDPSPHWQWDGLVADRQQKTLYWMPLPDGPEKTHE